MKKTLKDKLAQKLTEHSGKITRNMFASKIGISQASFSQIITGVVKNPGVYTVAKMAKELDCTVDELIGRDKYFSKKSPSKIEQIDFHPDLALSSAIAVLDTLSEMKKEDVSFEALLDMITAVYKYFIGKNSKNVDEYFVQWFVRYSMDSKTKSGRLSEEKK